MVCVLSASTLFLTFPEIFDWVLSWRMFLRVLRDYCAKNFNAKVRRSVVLEWKGERVWIVFSSFPMQKQDPPAPTPFPAPSILSRRDPPHPRPSSPSSSHKAANRAAGPPSVPKPPPRPPNRCPTSPPPTKNSTRKFSATSPARPTVRSTRRPSSTPTTRKSRKMTPSRPPAAARPNRRPGPPRWRHRGPASASRRAALVRPLRRLPVSIQAGNRRRARRRCRRRRGKVGWARWSSR